MIIDNNFLFLLKSKEYYKPIIYSENLDNLKAAYILCQYSFKGHNFNIDNFVLNQSNMTIPEIERLNFSFDEIMSFKK